MEEWKKAYENISKEVEEVDISLALSGAAFAVKDENELVSPPLHVHFYFRRSLISSSGICEMLQELAPDFFQSSSLKRCQESWMRRRK